MELRHIRYFVAVAESLNFTRAAERVHVTQSTLSHQISALELELGKALFDRSSKKVALTVAGDEFLAYAVRALQALDQGVGALKESAGELSGVVRVGTTHTFNLNFIPACAAAFMLGNPTVRMDVHELSADAINAGVTDGRLDLGIAYQPVSAGDLLFEALYNEEMVLAVSDAHPLAKRKRVRMAELHHQQLVLLPSEFSTRTMLDDCFRISGAEPIIVAEMNTVAPMLGLASRTEIGTIVARDVVPANAGLNAVPLEAPTPVRTPGILWSQLGKRTPQVRSFASIVRRLASRRSTGMPSV